MTDKRMTLLLFYVAAPIASLSLLYWGVWREMSPPKGALKCVHYRQEKFLSQDGKYLVEKAWSVCDKWEPAQ